MTQRAQSTGAETATSNTYAVYALVVLTLTYVVNFMDRFALVAMTEHIRADLGLSDAQLGLLTGFAFSLFYAVLGVPVAILADRVGRVRVIAASVALWSLMTILGSRASGFATLAASRIGVGIGEAGGTPPAHALITQTFTKRRLPLAMGVYATGSGIGLALGLGLGGHFANAYGWREALVLLGLPGLLLAPLVLFTLREPPRGAAGSRRPALGELSAALGRLARNRPLAIFIVGMGCAAFAGFSNLAWLPALHGRTFGLQGGGAIGLSQAIGLANIIGVLVGGLIGSVLQRWSDRAAYVLSCVACLLALPCLYMVHAMGSSTGFVLAAATGLFFHSLILAPVMTQVQLLSDAQDRSLSSAMLVLSINILGAGAGPLVVGLISDSLMDQGDAAALSAALKVGLVAYLIAPALFWLAGRLDRQAREAAGENAGGRDETVAG